MFLNPAIRMLALVGVVAIWPTHVAICQQEQSEPEFIDADLGIKLTLPDASWKKSDHSQGAAKVFVFSPDEKLTTRCSVLHMPKLVLPEGLLTRERQLQSMLKEAYQRVALDNVEFSGRQARRLEYRLAGGLTVEWELEDGDAYLIFQLAAPESSWKNTKRAQVLEQIRNSFEFSGAKKEAVETSVATPEQIRTTRLSMVGENEPAFELLHHELRVDIEPREHALHVQDRITLQSHVEGLKALTLYVSEVEVQQVESAQELKWEVMQREGGQFEDASVQELKLLFDDPLPQGEDITVDVVAHSDDFFHAIDQQLVAEVAVLGQVREPSSYSSHVIYYPVDESKGGSMDMTLTVPEGMTAVTGGQLVSSSTENGRSIFRYTTSDRRARLLPFGFASGNYVQRSGESTGGLRLSFYGYPGEEKLLDQRVELGVEAANIFERLMGPLPWQDVRFVHVTPERKETGVSLPGLVLISDRFFTDFEDVDVSDGNLADPDTLSLLVVADELSHQWNAYAVPLPNQLAEGISTFTNALFLERRAGRKAFDNALRYCRDAYIMSTGLGHDVAIADPAIYQTPAYRGIAFAKTAVVLGMLRELLGDEVFFTSWREAFQEFGNDQDGFQVVETAFSTTANRDLKWFFDQWFYRPGWAKLRITHAQDGEVVNVVCEQTQDADAFKMDVKLLAGGSEGQTHAFVASLESARTAMAIKCPFKVETIVLDSDEIGLAQVIED